MKLFARAVALSILTLIASSARLAFAIGVSGGDVPLPAKSGKLSWNGTYAELLAADALAECWTTQQDRYLGSAVTGPADPFIDSLKAQMSAASCKNTCVVSPTLDGVVLCPFVDSWLDGRKDSTCNVDALSGAPKSLDLSTLRAASQSAAYALPTAAALGLTGTGAVAARNSARNEVAYAELNLCMAQQLSAKLDTVQVAFASGDDLNELQEIVRQRALTASYEYAVISKALATTRAAPTVVNSPNYYLAPLALWGRGTFNNAAAWSQIGDDFASMIALMIDATRNSVQSKVRSAAAQSSFGIPVQDVPNTVTGLTGPRSDIVDWLLYGPGDSRYPVFLTFATGHNGPEPTAILTDMSAPEVGTLLGLARQANALVLQVDGAVVHVAASATVLYDAVENFLRAQDCTLGIAARCGAASGPRTNYSLQTKYGIDLDNHARALVGALAEAAFGPPTPNSMAGADFIYNGRFNVTYPLPLQQKAFHLIGNNTFTGTGSPNLPGASATGTVTIDPNFRITWLNGADREAGYLPTDLPVLDVDPAGDAPVQIGMFQKNQGIANNNNVGARTVGAATVLALVREAGMQLSLLTNVNGPLNIVLKAQPSLTLIEKAIGTRQVLVRQKLTSTANTSACTTCVTYAPAYSCPAGVCTSNVNVDVLASSDDPFISAAITNGIPNASDAVLDATYHSPAGTSNSSVTSLTYGALATTFTTSVGYQMRSATGSWNATTSPSGVTVILRGGTTGNFNYSHVYTGLIGTSATVPAAWDSPPGVVITSGGEFDEAAQKAWQFSRSKWSVPAFDAFDLPRDWAPAADASLEGDDGRSIQQHFLDRATQAASDATAALQQAFDTLQQDATDSTALASSEMRSSQLSTLNYQALCGTMVPCNTARTQRLPVVPACTGDTAFCTQMTTALNNIVGLGGSGVHHGFPLAADVDAELTKGSTTPTFSAYRGGQIQGLLLAQWNAWNSLKNALNTAVGETIAASADVTAADSEATAGTADVTATEAANAVALNQLVAQGKVVQTQVDQLTATQNQYNNAIQPARTTWQERCSPQAHDQAIQAGITDSGQHLVVYDGIGLKDPNGDSRSYSFGSLIAQQQGCQSAYDAFAAALNASDHFWKDAKNQLADLKAQQDLLDPNNPIQLDGADTRLAAAIAHQSSAQLRAAAAEQHRSATLTSALQSVQDAYGQLIASAVAIDQAFAQSAAEKVKIDLDASQANYDIRTRFGVRSRYHSYDLWRARALTENARRLAVAARRSIEARYVVDLSTLKAPEPFVDAPSLWADDVYASDLKPPIALGLTPSPATASGIYTNKLTDYVNNLKLFLDGYAVQRPTAQVRSDAEVIQLPGPAFQVVTSAGGANFSYVDPGSMGWSFYCPTTQTWVGLPHAADFSLTTPTPSWNTACAGTAPTLARFGFTLDPWGRSSGSTAQPPSTSHFNVRLGNLAINLVGSGIRDCSAAPDPSTCYAEPFIRFGLRHVGPAWVTGYDQVWRSLDIPVGNIDDGKALATEEWLDPVSNGFNRPDVGNVARQEFSGSPIGGGYELTIELTPDLRLERLERIQLLVQTSYWARQN